ASIAAFARLSLQLLAAGAPSSLVRGAHRAALDEARHAELASALASKFAGAPLRPGAIPIPAAVPVPHDLETLALEALLDGALNEGLAAAEARASARATDDEEERTTFAVIAREEARHAKLGEAIVAWCLSEGGAPIASA